MNKGNRAGQANGRRSHHAHTRAAGNGDGRLTPGNATQAFLFFRSFLRYPAMVGWLVPSSRFVVDSILRNVDWASTKLIVEYGPGLGTFTSRILERMRPDAQLIAFEINPEFIAFLKKNFSDPRLRIVETSAEDVDRALPALGLSQADYVISGIPFKPIPHELRASIIRKTHAILRPGGKLLVYQFSDAVLPYLRGAFHNVSCSRELLNVVPTRLFFCERQRG